MRRKAGRALCHAHQHCAGFIRHELSFFGGRPQPVEVCVCLDSVPRVSPYFSRASKRSCSSILCFWWAVLGGKALHPHQHSPAGQAGGPIDHGAVRGGAHEACLPPPVRGHVVRTWIPRLIIGLSNLKPANLYVPLN